jgi:hypothetical protein
MDDYGSLLCIATGILAGEQPAAMAAVVASEEQKWCLTSF